MEMQFTIRAEVERTSGPFASRDDLETEMLEAIEGANPGTLEPGDNEYEVTDWRVEAVEVKARPKPKDRPDILTQARGVMQALAQAAQETKEGNLALAQTSTAKAQNRMDGLFLLLSEVGLVKP